MRPLPDGPRLPAWLSQWIQLGKSNQNAFIERFNRTYRDFVPYHSLLGRPDDVREATSQLLIDYNEHCSHNTLGA